MSYLKKVYCREKFTMAALASMLSAHTPKNIVIRYVRDTEFNNTELIMLFDQDAPNKTTYTERNGDFQESILDEEGHLYSLEKILTFRLHVQVKDRRYIGTIHKEKKVLVTALATTDEAESEIAVIEIKKRKIEEIAQIIIKFMTTPRTPRHKPIMLTNEEYVSMENLQNHLKEILEQEGLTIEYDESNSSIYVNQHITIKYPKVNLYQQRDPSTEKRTSEQYPKQNIICIGDISPFKQGRFEIIIRSSFKHRYQYMVLKQSTLEKNIADITTFFISLKE